MVIEKINSWQIGVVAATLLSIVLHFALQVFALPDFGALKANDLPLIAVIVICGFPLCAQIAAKVLKGDFGADMLAAIAVVVALFLEEYLAATLVVLMLSGGQVLEEYAMRKASSVLGVLARRMPSKVHRKNGDLIEDIERYIWCY